VAWVTEKSSSFNCSAIPLAMRTMHLSSFLVSLLHQSWDEISFKGGGL
jgi:hypothetical protein